MLQNILNVGTNISVLMVFGMVPILMVFPGPAEHHATS